MNRKEFMKYFRSTKFDEELSMDDKLEIFCQALPYIPDNFVEIVNEILKDYSQEYMVRKAWKIGKINFDYLFENV